MSTECHELPSINNYMRIVGRVFAGAWRLVFLHGLRKRHVSSLDGTFITDLIILSGKVTNPVLFAFQAAEDVSKYAQYASSRAFWWLSESHVVGEMQEKESYAEADGFPGISHRLLSSSNHTLSSDHHQLGLVPIP